MKKIIYITAFTFLGVLVQFFVHAVLEMWYIGLLLSDFSKYGFGISWDGWILIHNIGTVVFLFLGAGFGFFQGKYWWVKIYKNGSHKY